MAKQAGRQARSHTGTIAGRKAGRDVRAWEGREDCRGHGKSNRKRCRETDAPLYILTGRTIHAQSYINEWTYRWPVRNCWYRAKNR